jgi:glycosyltransferase involved in cell wall biosynthesis
MTFSIIVVCLNAGEKLQQTIESILCQTEQDFEIIVKDGGSTDGSV